MTVFCSVPKCSFLSQIIFISLQLSTWRCYIIHKGTLWLPMTRHGYFGRKQYSLLFSRKGNGITAIWEVCKSYIYEWNFHQTSDSLLLVMLIYSVAYLDLVSLSSAATNLPIEVSEAGGHKVLLHMFRSYQNSLPASHQYLFLFSDWLKCSSVYPWQGGQGLCDGQGTINSVGIQCFSRIYWCKMKQ